MHLPASTALLLAATLTLAKPIPYDFTAIEQAWAQGHSEVDIHPGQTHRDMTPAWPILRAPPASASADDGEVPVFTLSSDERTMARGRTSPADAEAERQKDGSAQVQLSQRRPGAAGQRVMKHALRHQPSRRGVGGESAAAPGLWARAWAALVGGEAGVARRGVVFKGWNGRLQIDDGEREADGEEDVAGQVPVLRPRRGHKFNFNK